MSSSFMATNRVVLDPGAPTQHVAYGLLNGMAHPATNFFDQQGTAFEFGELEEALSPKFLQGARVLHDEIGKSLLTNRPPTLEIFPSWPMSFQQTTPRGSSQSADSTDTGSAQNTVSCKADAHLEPESPISKKGSDQSTAQRAEMTTDASRVGPPNPQPVSLTKTLRRLAQNREAARKSRLKKKAYVQQLESSRIKLSQLEQDLQRARSQGLFIGGGCAGGNVSSGAAIFDMEYARWLEENSLHMAELRGGLHAHLSDANLRVIVDACLTHYDDIFRLKGVAAKADVFHLLTGMWKTPTERCFLWLGGFRPSDLVKMLVPQLDPLTEQQFRGICSLQRSSQQAEEALFQGLEQLQQSLADTVANGSPAEGTHVGDYMSQMVLALGKLSNLEGFVRQADNLRQQTLHQMRQILTVRQAARCFLAVGEYHNRLRALSSLWASRPQENLNPESSCQTTTSATAANLQILQHPHNHLTSL